MSTIAPLANADALVTLAASAVAFKKWRCLDEPRVLAGTLYILLGAMVVATAKN